MTIRKAVIEDAGTAASLAIQMWKAHSVEELEKEFVEIIGAKDSDVFFAVVENRPIGFAQCGLRHDYVEGTDSSPVGYLEGVFIEEAYRRRGYAGKLLEVCESWAKEQGCSEFASDCELDNEDSLRFHLKMGFQEENRIICFAKRI